MGAHLTVMAIDLTSGMPVLQPSGVAECIERLAASGGSGHPLTVYRMQFHSGWRFEDAHQLVAYLRQLGVTHLYSSPILKARSGSRHGYDIVDHNAINPELGSEEDFFSLVQELKSSGMGVLLDIVPNHMGVGYGSNPWWQDVLENGRTSAYAEFFDIDWEPLKAELHGKVLLPVLGGQYGEELERGNIVVSWDDGGFRANYFDKTFALDPRTYATVLEGTGVLSAEAAAPDMALLTQIAASFRNLPPPTVVDAGLVAFRRREVAELKGRMAELVERSSSVRAAIERALRRINGRPGAPDTFDLLHQLLEAQAYRLAHWRVSAEEINYRRFFDINDLVGVRMENPGVFAATHRLIRRLLANRTIDGLRLDHPDGLFNPAQYLVRLQTLYAASQCRGPEPQGEVGEDGIEREVQAAFPDARSGSSHPLLYVVVEKILEQGEQLPENWAVDGTVGYEFGMLLTNLFIDGNNRRAFTNLYHRFLGAPLDPDSIIYESKHLILHTSLASEVAVLTHQLQEICSADRHARDFTLKMLADGIREVIACFPVYRTYVDASGRVSDRDRAYINEAVSRAKRRNESTAHAAFDLIRDILLLKQPRSAELGRKQLYFTMKFQQLTGPAMAKGLEDTACYIYNRLVSVNEVGGSPREFGITAEEFHKANQARLENWPRQLLETSTHDSKRSEDVRARLDVLSEMPKQWSAQVLRWRRANRTRKRIISDGRTVPDPNEEYLLYQTLVGAWPFQMESLEDRGQFLQRVQEYMNKAVHEAKVNLSWTNPNPEYVQALGQFLTGILEPGKGKRLNSFVPQLQAFLPVVLFFGAVNSLAQVLLKLTVPGVPDIYQGNEMFDFSMVDPDNRRPVDYQLRQQALEDLLERKRAGDLPALCHELLGNYQDGRTKLWTTLQALHFRREHPELLTQGSYRPLTVSGSGSQHVVAFAREHQTGFAVVVVPRFACTLMQSAATGSAAPYGSEAWLEAWSEAWKDTQVHLPVASPARLTNLFTGEWLEAEERSLACGGLFRHFPVALLSAE